MDKMLMKVYKNRALSKYLSVVGHIISALFAVAFFFCVSVMICEEDYRGAVLFVLPALIGYLAVTLTRSLIDAPRPYEVYGFFEVLPKRRTGKSFPSRHAYSAFAIATLSFSVSSSIGIVLLALGFIMCCSRALLGIHFIRDLLAGMAIGVISGVIGLILI